MNERLTWEQIRAIDKPPYFKNAVRYHDKIIHL